MGWGVVGKLCVDGVDISHPLAEVAVHYGRYAGPDSLACLLDDYGCGRFQCEEVGADVLYCIGVIWAERIVNTVIGVVADVTSGRDREELCVVPSLFGGDVCRDERREHINHASLLCIDDMVECLCVLP